MQNNTSLVNTEPKEACLMVKRIYQLLISLVNTEPKEAPLQLPEETTSLIKASAEGVSAGVTEPGNMVIREYTIRCSISESPHRLARDG